MNTSGRMWMLVVMVEWLKNGFQVLLYVCLYSLKVLIENAFDFFDNGEIGCFDNSL